MGYLNLIRYYLPRPSVFFLSSLFWTVLETSLCSDIFLKTTFPGKYALNLFSTQNSSLVSLAMAATLLHWKYSFASYLLSLRFLSLNTLPLVLPPPIHWPLHHLRVFVLCFRKSKSGDSFSGVAPKAPVLEKPSVWSAWIWACELCVKHCSVLLTLASKVQMSQLALYEFCLNRQFHHSPSLLIVHISVKCEHS